MYIHFNFYFFLDKFLFIFLFFAFKSPTLSRAVQESIPQSPPQPEIPAAAFQEPKNKLLLFGFNKRAILGHKAGVWAVPTKIKNIWRIRIIFVRRISVLLSPSSVELGLPGQEPAPGNKMNIWYLLPRQMTPLEISRINHPLKVPFCLLNVEAV